jgi:hypothetical protein
VWRVLPYIVMHFRVSPGSCVMRFHIQLHQEAMPHRLFVNSKHKPPLVRRPACHDLEHCGVAQSLEKCLAGGVIADAEANAPLGQIDHTTQRLPA